VLSLLVAVACADRLYEPPAARADSDEIAILRDERVIEDDGRYNFDMETANGIKVSESGSPVGDEGAINSAGSFSYVLISGLHSNTQLHEYTRIQNTHTNYMYMSSVATDQSVKCHRYCYSVLPKL